MNRVTRQAIVFCLLVAIAGLMALPAAADASGDGGDKPASSGKAAERPDATVAAAQAAAETVRASPRSSPARTPRWKLGVGRHDEEPAGTTLVYRWAAAGATASTRCPCCAPADGTPEAALQLQRLPHQASR